jgi:serine/threonine-protein kinase Chk2
MALDVAPEILENAHNRMYTRAVDIWSLGVVLYICLCGFPPFSDELYSDENPYTLSQQIKLGHFEYPSPYWDSIADPALELIDRMLTVDVDKRITVDECLEHPWITQASPGPNDSTDGLTGAMGQLDFSKRKVRRERTLLSSVNDVRVNKIIETAPGEVPVKIFAKKPSESLAMGATAAAAASQAAPLSPVAQARSAPPPRNREETPASQRDAREFMQLGGKGDQPLMEHGGSSSYAPDAVLKAAKSPA